MVEDGKINEVNQIEINKPEVEDFVERNIIRTEKGCECVDGRCKHKAEGGYLARPGADFGYVMGLLALRKDGIISTSPTECAQKIYDIVMDDCGEFHMHTDSHAEENEKLTGCGHIMNATIPQNAQDYGVDPEEIKEALKYVRDNNIHPKTVEESLKGEHKEEFVILNKSLTHTVNHQDDEDLANGKMAFVYDAALDEKRIEYLVEKLNIPNLTVENFKGALNKQTQATLVRLALGKEIFITEIDKNGTLTHLESAGFVEKAS